MNALGMIGKGLTPVFFILATRLYGPSSAGVYYAAWVALEVGIALTLSGFNAGVVMLTSRHLARGESQEGLYQVLANGLVATLGISAILVALVQIGTATVLPHHLPRPGYAHALGVLSLSLPFTVIPGIVASASKGHLTMKWDVLLGAFAPPMLLGLFVVGAALLGAGPEGLLWGHVLAEATRAGIALVVFGRIFSFRRLGQALLRFRLHRPLYAFALPQSLNMTFNTFMTNVDVMMLAALGARPALVMFYGMGAQIASNVRQARLVFSRAFEPVIARLHARGDRAGLSDALSRVSRWATLVGLPLALACALLRHDLIRLFHGSFTGDTTFMLILILSPMLASSFGVAGNVVVMTGHSGYNLLNSVLAAVMNATLNFLLIPPMGLNGAALATLLSTSAVTAIQLVEADRLVGARIRLRSLATPYAAMVIPTALAVSAHGLSLDQSLAGRLIITALALASFALGLKRLGLDPEDRALFSRSPAAQERGS